MLKALVAELELRKKELLGHSIETIYFGGGTPSLLSNGELQIVLDQIHKNYQVVAAPEITLEANPDDLSKERLVELSKTPINRLSIGIQSFFDEDLKSMNRAHTAAEAKACLKTASKFFDNITIDLIYGIPEMSLERWRQNLQKAFDFGVPHISSYALTVEPKTALDSFIKKGSYPPMDEALALEHFDLLVSETQKQGFVQYEISNFGKQHYFSKHNTCYWQGKPYIGIGPSAHSFVGNQRSWNVANNTKYIQAIEQSERPSTVETLSKDDQFNEYIMTGLRTIWGVSLQHVQSQFGVDYKNTVIATSRKFIDKNLLQLEGDKFVVTKKGKFLADGIAAAFFVV